MSASALPALLLLAILAPPPQAVAVEQSATMRGDRLTLAEFRSELERLRSAIESSGAADAPEIAASVPVSWRVTTSSDDVLVPAAWLKIALASAPSRAEAWPATRDALRARLAAMDDLLQAPAGNDGGRRARAREAVQVILAREEFQQSAASLWRQALQRRIGEWLERLWSRLGLGGIAGRPVALGFAWGAAILALALLGWWLVRIIIRQPGGAALNLGSGDQPSLGARDWALRAVAEARAGNGREAVRLAYHAALVRIEEQGAWRVDEARTPREYLPLLRTSDARHALMADLTARFERIWYGNRDVAPDDTPRVTEHLEALGCLHPGERPI